MGVVIMCLPFNISSLFTFSSCKFLHFSSIVGLNVVEFSTVILQSVSATDDVTLIFVFVIVKIYKEVRLSLTTRAVLPQVSHGFLYE